MLRELLKYSILTSVVAIVGCSTVPKEDHSTVLMEDVIVEKTTVRSTTHNPKPKSNGGVYISGDNINIGTIIVNSPNAKVDNSINTIQQQAVVSSNGISSNAGPAATPFSSNLQSEPANHNDRDFFKNMDSVFMKLAPSFIMRTVIR